MTWIVRPADTTHVMTPADNQHDSPDGPGTCSAWLRALLSGLITFHLIAVFVGPMASSILTAVGRLPAEMRPEQPPLPWIHNVLQPYLDVLYLNHGYGFFAPDPGPSHLIRYRLQYDDGRTERGQFPDTSIWPRLRYHRHFMLAEQVSAESGQAYARHLLKKHGAARVTVERVRHFLARPEEVLAGMALRDVSTYQTLDDPVTVTREELTASADREGGSAP